MLYEPNVLGFKGPRRMTILMPERRDQDDIELEREDQEQIDQEGQFCLEINRIAGSCECRGLKVHYHEATFC